MDPNVILLPVFAMATLSFIVLFRLGYLLKKAIANKQVSEDYFKVFRGEGSETDQMIAVSRNYINLFEAPVLFYVVMIFFYICFRVDHIALALAWGFVACRYIHTLAHIGANIVRVRAMAFGMGQVFLFALWLKFALSIYYK